MTQTRVLALVLSGTIALAAAPLLARNAPLIPFSARPQAVPSSVPTLKAKAQLVVVDVVVADSKQAPVHNLKASDFTVLENGAAQQVTGFEEHVTMPPALAAKIAAPVRPLPPGIFSNFTAVPEGSAVNVLLLDTLNTQMKDQVYVRDQLRAYLKNMPEGTRVALFALNGRLVMLQGFTSDLASLKAAAERSGASSSAVLSGMIDGTEDPVGNGAILSVPGLLGEVSGGNTDKIATSMGKVAAEENLNAVQLQFKTTMDAMKQLAHYLAGIPGRKNLIWFCGTYPENFRSRTSESIAEYRETANLLARSRVAVYPVGARGLTTINGPIREGGRSNVVAQVAAHAQSDADNNLPMDQIAADTGGQVYLDGNGLSEAVSKAIESGSNYYTLSYTPTDSRQNGEFHKIQVKLAQQGLTLTYRDGYYEDRPEGKAKRGAESAAAIPMQPDGLTSVMMRGAPDATEIMLKLQVLPVNGAVEEAIAKGNIVNPNPAAKLEVKGPFRRYAIDIAADANDIRITPTADGHYQFSAEVITYVYDANSVLINTAVLKAHGNLSASTYANMRRIGLPFHQEISVPASGDFYLRTSVHDLETDRYGAVELPVASVANLTPLGGAGAATTATR